ncbi:MAG: PorV/PorQ family protein [Elusimicrobiota bacterium]
MKKIFKLFVVVARFIGLFCLINQVTTFDVEAGTTSAAFLDIPVGVRNIAMGETGATSNDVNAIYWNPSGLADVSSKQLSLMHAIWFEDISYENLYYCQPMGIGVLGFGLNYLYMHSIEKYDEYDNFLNETYKPSDMMVILGYARKLLLRGAPPRRGDEAIAIGLNIKYISSKLEDETGTAFAIDVGGIYDKFRIKNSELRIGLAIQNIGTKMKFIDEKYALPMNIKLGCSYNFMPLISQSPNLLISAFDINKPIDNDVRVNFGTEYSRKFGENILLSGRVGYKTNTEGYDAIDGLSVGFGFSFQDYSIDYAFVPYGDLGDTHRISLIARFAGASARQAKFGGSGEKKERKREEGKKARESERKEVKVDLEKEAEKEKIYQEGIKYLEGKNYIEATGKFNAVIQIDSAYKDVLAKWREAWRGASQELIKVEKEEKKK